jgi:hypothetical protein
LSLGETRVTGVVRWKAEPKHLNNATFSRAPYGKPLDTDVQISALGKLKFTQCAPISGLPEIGFFRAQVG